MARRRRSSCRRRTVPPRARSCWCASTDVCARSILSVPTRVDGWPRVRSGKGATSTVRCTSIASIHARVKPSAWSASARRPTSSASTTVWPSWSCHPRRSPAGSLTPAEAVLLQRELAARVVRTGRVRPRTIAGADTSIRAGRVHAALCLFSYPGLELLETARAVRPVEFPYVPGLLAFRELPALLEAATRLARAPDLLLVDGHGLAHPRRFGLACHLGLALDLPALGCGKSLLVGEFRPPGERRGSGSRLLHRGEVIGRVLRTRSAVKPVFVSIGHRIDLATAARIVLACAPRYRLPEPIRAADRLAGSEPYRLSSPP